jgi:3-hydroxyacyl-CoA dehydrogenase
VVASLSGMALGGGCEIVLHASAVQAHMESQPGLVEANVGLIPGWGGCKEMLLRHAEAPRAFAQIMSAKVAGSADEARDMKILRHWCRISMNRARLLNDAKTRCLELAKGYAPPKPVFFKGGVDAAALLTLLGDNASPHDKVIGNVLANVLAGQGDEKEIMKREHDGFMELIKTPATQARIAHMLETGKPLKN